MTGPTWSGSGSVATFLATPLAPSQSYTATFTCTNTSGTPLASPYTWTFTTAGLQSANLWAPPQEVWTA